MPVFSQGGDIPTSGKDDDRELGALDFITSSVSLVETDEVASLSHSSSASFLTPLDYVSGYTKEENDLKCLDFISGTFSSTDFYSSGNWGGYGNIYPPSVPDLSAYVLPAEWGRVTSGFGYRESFKRVHQGIDFAMNIGDTVRVVLPGVVRHIGYEHGGYGHFVVVEHDNGIETRYAHLSRALVCIGDIVDTNHAIALSGNSGNSTGPHLHFEARFRGRPVNPVTVFDFKSTPKFVRASTSDAKMKRTSQKNKIRRRD